MDIELLFEYALKFWVITQCVVPLLAVVVMTAIYFAVVKWLD